ncbi:transglutaminase family protein [Haloferula sp.]|uniref:transglutaminase family protein n=1 Tax=Haloferula sp. TaxID=2497595 RepID=UPI003C774872
MIPASIESHLLRIRHRTHYLYHFPVTFEPHRLVIRPREGHDLRVESLSMIIEPQASVTWTRDIFGNSVAQAHFDHQAAELVIESDVTVRRFFDPAKPPHLDTGASSYPLQYDPLEHGIITGYLTPVYPEESASVQQWIASIPQPGGFASAEDFVISATKIIHQTIGYRRREEKGVQTPDTTLSLKTGSCRDVATLLMEALRHLGIAARFASGYLDCPNTRAARGSTHAWTEVYFPRLGWRGFDPTIGEACDHRHIVTGTSHHPRGVMPVSGRIFGPGNAFQSLTVGVEFSSPEAVFRQSQIQS